MDLRVPSGLFFALLGVILAGLGVVTIILAGTFFSIKSQK